MIATITKTPSGTWKAIIRRAGWPTTVKTFRTKRDAEDWSRRAEDEMVRGVFIQRSPSETMLMSKALERYVQEVVPTKKESTLRSASGLNFETRLVQREGGRFQCKTTKRMAANYLPELYHLRRKGYTFNQLAQLLTQADFKIAPSTVRIYYNEMLPARLEECKRPANLKSFGGVTV